MTTNYQSDFGDPLRAAETLSSAGICWGTLTGEILCGDPCEDCPMHDGKKCDDSKLGEWTNEGQAVKILEEADEAKSAQAFWCYGNGSGDEDADRTAYGMELMDVIHAAETALRMEFSDAEVVGLQLKVIEKNRKRGYYKGGAEVL